MRGAEDSLETAIAGSFDTSEIDRGALGDIQPGIVIARDGRGVLDPLDPVTFGPDPRLARRRAFRLAERPHQTIVVGEHSEHRAGVGPRRAQ